MGLRLVVIGVARIVLGSLHITGDSGIVIGAIAAVAGAALWIIKCNGGLPSRRNRG